MIRSMRGLRTTGLLMLALLLTTMTGCAMATQQTALPADGSYQRFIVKYREASAPGRDPAAVQPRLDAAASTVAPVTLAWQRRMGVQADVFTTSVPLDADAAQELMQRLSDDPDVEYVEPDGRMGIGPGPALPERTRD
ncbi:MULTISPECIES: hypothetical protein [Luteimonas]|uniref:hypothetical protein n=1 Tax=Luteimonas TaxID=83614 RepID=UPI001180C464|nr:MULTISPECIES: hypothetical protein [Luteimonas]